MKVSAALASIALLARLTLANPTPSISKRATQVCDQWGSVQTGSYIVYNNLWGASSGSGSQCTTVNSLSGSTLAWSTSWTWSGGPYSVKSYANAVVKFTPKQISAVSSIPSKWSWSYSGSKLIANVAYDMFTASSCSSTTAQYEIMIWLSALGGAGPISSTGSPIATPTIAGATWSLSKGPNGSMTVFSFVAKSDVKNFSGDLKAFLTYLTSSQGLPSSQCLYSLGAGTEPFTGSGATLTTSAYSVAVN